MSEAKEIGDSVVYHAHCTCTAVRYSIVGRPLFVHCCHCSWCQRESGSAFVVNVMTESSNVRLLSGTVEEVNTPSLSGSGQQVVRCATCRIALWSHYGMNRSVAYVRLGTFDEPHMLAPDVHIFTSSKQPWVQLPAGVPAFAEYYEPEQLWPAHTKERLKTLGDQAS